MEHIVLYLVGAFVSWLLILEARLHAAQKKINKIAREKSDEQIRGTLKVLTNDELDSILREDLSEASGDPKT